MGDKEIIDILIAEDILKEEQKEFFQFGIRQIFYAIINIATTVCIGWIFGRTLYSICFLLFFIPIRSYSGGYHSRTAGRCYVLSICLVGTVMMSFQTDFWSTGNSVVIIVLTGIALGILSPVDNVNHRLDKSERTVMRKIARRIICIESIIGLLSVFFNVKIFYQTIAAGMLLATVLAVLGIQVMHTK